MSALGLELTGLYDCARLARELGISRTAAERVMRALPKQTIPGLQKVYVRGADVQAYLDEHVHDVTVTNPTAPAELRR